MESTIQINSQLNGQVEFQFVRNTYPLDDKLYCYYSVPVTGTFKPEHGDCIGIFQVGWTGLGEVRCKKMISVEEFGYNQETGCGYVVFEPFHLPKNTEQFHQFVYIKNGEIVRGTSKPFQFEINPFFGQPERMIELGRQQQEIRKQIERIEKEGQRQFTYKNQEPTLQNMIAQLRQNEERISNIKQQYEELKGCQQQPKKWTHVQYRTQPWGVQTGMTGMTGMTGLTGMTGMTGLTGMTVIPTEITVFPTGVTGVQTGITGIPTGINGIPTGVQQCTVVCGVQQPTEMTFGQRLVFPEGLQEIQQTIQTLKYGLQELKQEMPKFPTVYQTKGFYYKQQIQQLEEQIAEFKRLLKIKMIQQVCERMGLVGQQWFTPLVQKLKEFECCLKLEKLELNNVNEIPIEMMTIRGVQIERMLTKLGQMINFFECHYENPTFEETKYRFVLTQLRELECGLNEFYQKHTTFWTTVVPQQTGKIQQQKRQIRELINEVQQVVQMRIKHFNEVLTQFVEMEQQPRCEDKLWKEIRNLECQLYGIKQLDVEVEFTELKQWLNDFERKIEQQPLNMFDDECKIVVKQEQLYQQIRELKGFWQQYKKIYTRGFFHLQNEHMQQYRYLIRLVGLIESQMVEFHSRLGELKMKIEQQQYQTILKKQLQLFQQIKSLKYYLPYEQQEMVTFLVRQKVQQVVQDVERYLPVHIELYQPIHKQIQKLVQHIKNLEFQPIEEQQQWEVKRVLKQHFGVLRQLQQQIRECERIVAENLIEGTINKVGQYQPTTYQQQYHHLVKQQIRELYQFIQNHIEFFGYEQQQPECESTFGYLVGLTCDLSLPKYEDLNNNNLTITFEPSTIKEWSFNTLVELVSRFNQLRMIEQETIVSELVQRYIQCLKRTTGVDEEIRRKFEQLYVENNKLGHMLRIRINEVAELKKQFQELQIAKSLLEMRLVQTGRKYENIEFPLPTTTYEKRQFNVEQQPEFYEPRISITVERVTPVQPESDSEDEEEQQYYKPTTVKKTFKQIVGDLEEQLTKMRMTEECPKPTTTQGWFVRSQSGQEFPTKVNFYPEECLRTVEGSLLVRQQPKPYQIRDDIYINQLQKKLNKLAVQQPTGIEQESTLFSL